MTTEEALAVIRARIATDPEAGLKAFDEVLAELATTRAGAAKYRNGGGQPPAYWDGLLNQAALIEEALQNAFDLCPDNDSEANS